MADGILNIIWKIVPNMGYLFVKGIYKIINRDFKVFSKNYLLHLLFYTVVLKMPERGNNMGIRFRKSIKIAPGIKMNINKNSTSFTAGGKGIHYTVNSKGKTTKSVGIPGTGISYTETSSFNKSSNSAPPGPTDNDSIQNNKKPKGCLTYLLCLLLLCVAIPFYAFLWMPGIVATIYFILRKNMEKHSRKKKILISSLITITSFILFLVFAYGGSNSKLTGITAEWPKNEFDINDMAEVKITPSPSTADIKDLGLSTNDIADLKYKDGKAIITFKKEGTASIIFTANGSVKSKPTSITVINTAAEEQRIAEKEKKAEEEKLKAEQEAQQKAEEEARLKAEQEAQQKAEEEAQQKAEEEARLAKEAEQQVQETMVWIPATGSKYHSKSSCSGMNNPTQVTEQEAINQGFEPCKRCH